MWLSSENTTAERNPRMNNKINEDTDDDDDVSVTVGSADGAAGRSGLTTSNDELDANPRTAAQLSGRGFAAKTRKAVWVYGLQTIGTRG